MALRDYLAVGRIARRWPPASTFRDYSVIDFGVNKPPTPVAVFLFVPWGLYLVVFIFYLLVVIDFGVNKPPTPIYDLTFDTSA
jgi:hypothetical protein